MTTIDINPAVALCVEQARHFDDYDYTPTESFALPAWLKQQAAPDANGIVFASGRGRKR